MLRLKRCSSLFLIIKAIQIHYRPFENHSLKEKSSRILPPRGTVVTILVYFLRGFFLPQSSCSVLITLHSSSFSWRYEQT